MPQDAPIDPAPPALASLHHSFAMALSGVKLNTAGQANSALKKAKTASKKKEVIERHFAAWREGCADAIRKFFPQYIHLGLAYPDEVKSELVKWAEDNAWIPLCAQCGVLMDGDLFPWRSHRSHSVLWWLAVAIHGNMGVNNPENPLWRAPDWLAKDPAQTDKLIADWSARLSGRFCGVLSEENESARVTIAIATAPPRETPSSSTLRSAAKSVPAQPLPASRHEYRERERQPRAGSATLKGRPRKDALADEAAQLKGSGLSYARISLRLNQDHGQGTATAESVRKLINSRKFKSAHSATPPTDKTPK